MACSGSESIIYATPEIVMLRYYGWRWQMDVQNMIGIGYGQCSVPEYAGPPHLLSLPHRAHAVAENLGTESPTLIFL